jgi:hypothetical protein
MTCALCEAPLPGPADRCPRCRARLDAAEHERYRGLQFVLARLRAWYGDGALESAVYLRLRGETQREMDALAQALREEEIIEEGIFVIEEPPKPPARPAPVGVAPPPPVPPPPAPVLRPKPVEAPPPPPPVAAPAPVAPPRDFWRNLASPRNVGLLLNMGTLLFSVGLAVTIYTEWDKLTAHWQMLILFGGTAAVLGIGHALRRTMLSLTGRALVALGTIALPIDFFAVARSGLLPGIHDTLIGVAACLSSGALYAAFARLYRDRRYVYLLQCAGLGLWIFAFQFFRRDWGVTAATTAPVLLIGYLVYHFWLDRRPLDRKLWLDPVFFFLHSATAAATGWLVAAGVPAIGQLNYHDDWIPIVASAACFFAFYYFSAWRTQRISLAWGGLPFLLAGFADLLWGLDVAGHDVGRWMVYFGLLMSTPLGVQRIERLRPLALPLVWMGASIATIGLLWSAGAYVYGIEPALRSLISSLVAAGLFCVAASIAVRSPLLSGTGLTMIVGAGHLALVLAHEPLRAFAPYYGLAGAALGAGVLALRDRARFLTRPAAAVGLVAALIALVLQCPPWMGATFESYPALGLCAAAGAALALTAAALSGRNRLVTDYAFAAIALAVLYALRLLQLPTTMMGVAGVALGGALLALSRANRFLRPSIFVSVAAFCASIFYGAHLYVAGDLFPAALTMLSAALCLGAAHFAAPHKMLGATTAILLAAGTAILMQHHGIALESALRGAVAVAAGVLAVSTLARRFGRNAASLSLEAATLCLLGLPAVVALLNPPDARFWAWLIVLLAAHQWARGADLTTALARGIPLILGAIAASLIQWEAVRPAESALLFLLLAVYGALASARDPARRWCSAPAFLALSASAYGMLMHFDVPHHWRFLAMTPLAIAGMLVGRRLSANPLMAAAALVTLAVTLWVLGDVDLWSAAHRRMLEPSIASALITAGVAGALSIRGRGRPPAALANAFCALYLGLAYGLLLQRTDSTHGGPPLMFLASVLVAGGLLGLFGAIAERRAAPAWAGLPLLLAAGTATMFLCYEPGHHYATYFGLFGAALGASATALRRRAEFLALPASGIGALAATLAILGLIVPDFLEVTFNDCALSGLLAAAGTAAAFAAAAPLHRQRPLADLAYLSAVAAALFALRLVDVPTDYLGVVGIIAAALLLLATLKLKETILRPSMASTLIVALLATAYGGYLYLDGNSGVASETMFWAAAYAAVVQFATPYKFFGHPAALLVAMGYLFLMQYLGIALEPALRGSVGVAAAVLAATAVARRLGRAAEAFHLDLTTILLLGVTACGAATLPHDLFLFGSITALMLAHPLAGADDPRLSFARDLPLAVCAFMAAALLWSGDAPRDAAVIFLLLSVTGFDAGRRAGQELTIGPAFFALAAAGWAVLTWREVGLHWHGLGITPLIVAAVLAARTLPLRVGKPLAGAAAIVAVVVTLWILGRPEMWTPANRALMTPSIFMSLALGLTAAAFAPRGFRGTSIHVPTALASVYIVLTIGLTAKRFSTGTQWDGPAVMAGAFAVTGIGAWLRRRGRADHAISPTAVGFAASLVALAVTMNDEAMRGWTFLMAGLLYWLASMNWRRPFFVYASVVALGAGNFLLGLHHDFDPKLTGFFMVPTSLAMTAMAWDLSRRYGKEFGAPMGVAGLVVALAATAIAWGHPLALALHLAYDALMFGFLATVGGLRHAMVFSSLSLLGAFVAFLHHTGLPLQQTVCSVIGISILQMLAARAMLDRWRSHSDAFHGTALMAAMASLVWGGVPSELYLNGADTPWGILALGLSALLYGLGAFLRRQAALGYLSAASAFAGYLLTCRHYALHEIEFYTIPLGLTVLVWNYALMRRRLERVWTVVLDLAAVTLLLLPSILAAFDRAADPNALVALLVSLMLVVAGMALRRRSYLLSGSFGFVGMTVAKGVHFLVEVEAPRMVWAMLVGALLILLAASIELTRRGQIARLRAAADRTFADWE